LVNLSFSFTNYKEKIELIKREMQKGRGKTDAHLYLKERNRKLGKTVEKKTN
jgi:hypothetical protein